MPQSTKTLLITGASSYVGARIYFDLQTTYTLVGTYFNNPLSRSFLKLDLTDEEAVKKLFEQTKPDVVIHVANYPSPRNAIGNEENFRALNKKATDFIVKNANAIGAQVVFISSQAANNPNDLYGQLKRDSEELTQSVNAGYLILRPSLLVGLSPNTTNPRPFNRILHCLGDTTRIAEFDTSWKLQPSYVGHLSRVIDTTIQNSAWDKVVPVFIDEIVTQYQIAQDVLSTFGISVNQIDQHMKIPPSKDDLTYFNSLILRPQSYQDMIQTIQEEIRNRDKFKV